VSGAPAPAPEREPSSATPPAPGRLARLARAGATLAVVYAALIFWESSNAHPFPFLPSSILDEDKLLHAGGYALLGVLLRLALARVQPARRALGLAVLLAALYGATDELHQRFVPGRSADPLDWTADVVGALAGAALASAFLRRRVGAGSIRA
jgi:VanZ family protein